MIIVAAIDVIVSNNCHRKCNTMHSVSLGKLQAVTIIDFKVKWFHFGKYPYQLHTAAYTAASFHMVVPQDTVESRVTPYCSIQTALCYMVTL